MNLTIAEFVWWSLIGSAGLVVFCTLVSRSFHARAERRARARRVICRLCLHAFEDSSRDRVVACPACAALNERSTTP